MNPAPVQTLPAALRNAVQRLKTAAREAAERTVASLGVSALASANVFQRDALLGAQFELNRKLALFCDIFDEDLDQRLRRELQPRGGPNAASSWDDLSLVDNHEVEQQVSADRFGAQLAQDCEAEQREFDALVGALLQPLGSDVPRNPLRTEVIGNAVLRGVDEVTDRPEQRKALAAELARSLAAAMPQTYARIVGELRAAGIRPAAPSFRISERGALTRSGTAGSSRPGALDAPPASGPGGLPGAAQAGPPAGSAAGWAGSGHGRLGGPGPARGRTDAWQGAGARAGGTPFGQVDAGLMTLIRQLAFTDLGPELSAAGASQAGAFDDDASPGPQAGQPVAPNLIRTHRDALRQASTGALDHMVIDVIGSLFDQILSDPKVPPQMARQIARLQLPVLRAALGDPSFFSSRKHPVRRLVNRIASLGSAFENLDSGAGRRFVALVRELVQEIVEGDFDQIEVYEHKLGRLEAFIVEQARTELQAQDGAAAMLEERETDLRLQQRYAQQLLALLKPVPVPDFVRDFVAQVWSQAMMRADRLDGPDSARAQRLRHAARELVMSVQPKGSPEQRKAFLMTLPVLMKELNEGMDLIGWDDAARKAFFGRLLPAHAESLKGQALRTLDYNLLVRQVDAAIGEAKPAVHELPPPPPDAPAVRDDIAAPAFSAEERQRIGLVDEAAVDWDGKVDIDLGEPEVREVDLDLAGLGLPKAEAPEPASGRSLADHVQIGFAYRMHLDGQWHKVRLAHVSPGRSFFVFNRGSRHQQTISLTHRMLVRLCEAGRLRAFENGYLIERATARVRRQLAALGGSGARA
ncbi:MAG: DUF1631 family protein [Proteobacteria bacterium]|nr:DUF1631 family protein [Pseudomonadota bacterium]